MAQLQKVESQTMELKCCANQIFQMYKNNMGQLTKLLPETYKSIQVLQGDGKSVGTVRLWKFLLEDSLVFVKERIKAVDEKNMTITFCIFEGDLMNYYENMELKFSVTPKSGNGSQGGCLVKWCVEYEKKTGSVSPPNDFIDLLIRVTKRTDVHLLKA